MEALRALALAGILVACALPVGAGALRLAGLEGKDAAGTGERWLLSAAAGLGVIAYAFTLLGLAGLFFPGVVLLLPPALALVTLPLAGAFLSLGRGGAPRAGPDGRPGAKDVGRLVAIGCLVALALAVLAQDLAPPTDYDGLLYHLVAPRAFLEAGRIVYLPHNFSANLPALGELLFAPGIAGGSDRAPQLVHAVAGGLAVGLTYTFGSRLFGPRPAFWGAAGFAATALVPFLATRAYIDLFTVLFGLVAVASALLWHETGRGAWLRVAGGASGLALATKYSALSLVLVLGAVILLMGWTAATGTRSSRLRAVLGAGAVFAGGVLLAALPWYARQALELGNPVWPMYFGGRDWDATRVEQLTYFVGQYGAGAGLRSWLLLPWNVYAQSWRFGHVPDSGPPLLAVFAPLALLIPRGVARWLLLIVVAGTALWARGWQDLRFLLTLYPLMALLGAAGLDALLRRRPFERGGPVGPALVSAAVAVLCLQAATRHLERARDVAGVVLGREPVAAYLGRRLTDFRALTFLNDQVAPGRTVLFLGDGQIWYCRPRCIPDPAHDNVAEWFVRPGGVGASLDRLRAAGVSHILLSKVDYWYLEHQDPEDRLRRQLAEFYAFKAAHLELVYEDAWTEVYRGRW
jgi:4-amino-4-deoxy-L-arabinose transferase-like glycosyltransferase